MESLKELNNICQKANYKKTGNWMVRHILRDAALPATWLLLHTKITANQVTLIALLIGMIGIALFAIPPRFAFLIGALLVQLWYYLDHVDGQIARYRKTASLSGRYFDFMMHHIIHGFFFFGLGLFGYFQYGQVGWVISGFMMSFLMMLFNISYDVIAKTFIEKIQTAREITTIQTGQKKTITEGKPQKGTQYLKRCYFVIHKLCEIHVLMNIFTVAALMNVLIKPTSDIRIWLIWIYAPLLAVLTVTRLIYVIRGKKIDAGFDAQFKIQS